MSNFTTHKGFSKILQTKKRPYQIINKPTEVTYNLIDQNKKPKETTLHRNNIILIKTKTLFKNYTVIIFCWTPLKHPKKSSIKEYPTIQKHYKNQQTKRQKIHQKNTLKLPLLARGQIKSYKKKF